MTKHKKKIVIIVMSIIIFLSYLLSVLKVEAVEKNHAEQTQYKDWSELTELDKAYSYSRIFYNENTEVKILKNDGTLTEQTRWINGLYNPQMHLHEGDELIVLITNCAINEKEQALDVVIKLNNINEWHEKSDGIYIELASDYKLASQDKPGMYDYIIEPDIGNLIVFGLHARQADCNFTITYYISGTYSYDKENNRERGIFGDITCINGYYYDVDTWSTTFKNRFLQGNEGLSPNVGKSTIYYNKNKTSTSETYIHLQEIDNGIAAEKGYIAEGNDTAGDWYQSAAYVATTNINNSTYSFKYGGQGCGIFYKFMSPYPLTVRQEFYKIKLYTADGNMINSIELRDGKAISELKDSFITDAIYLIADNEIVQGSRIEIETKIKVKNNSALPCKNLAIEQKLAGGLVCNTDGWETDGEIATLRVYGDENSPVIAPYGEYEVFMVASRLLASREYEFQNAVIAYEINGKIEATSEQGLSETIRIIPPFGKTRRICIVLVGGSMIAMVIIIRKFIYSRIYKKG